MSLSAHKKSLSNTATEIIFNDKAKTYTERGKDLKIYLGNTRTNTFLFCSRHLLRICQEIILTARVVYGSNSAQLCKSVALGAGPSATGVSNHLRNFKDVI